jgi:hypothetical protein
VELEAALVQASDEVGLQSYYRDCVRPLLREETRFPRCCGSGCEPCSATLIRVAVRVRELMGLPPRT